MRTLDKNIVEQYKKNSGILHIGLDFNVDPMSAVSSFL